MKTLSLAVDIGGTFTDAVVRSADGRTWVDKSLTTYADLLDGFFTAAHGALRRAKATPADVDDVVVHATTIVTNCVIQRRGARTALLTTAGFRDVLHIRDESRSDILDNQAEFAEPLVAREHAFGVNERTLATGRVVKEIDSTEVEAIVGELLKAGIESVAVSFLHSYRNPANERAVGKLIATLAPQLYLSLSSEVAPQIREFRRASTTVVNAYAMPRTQPYLKALSGRLKAEGFKPRPMIMLSSGGVIGSEIAGRFPVRMIESGPAAGALAACYFSQLLTEPTLISFDMGGTTAKAAFIKDGEPYLTGLFEVDRKYRFQPGSGIPIVVPSIDMIEIGAGGGSIASADALGLLKVGPESAGSEPGPVCYGKGGAEPTVTDANLVLGMLDEGSFLGGDLKLDASAARKVMAELGRMLASSAEQAALGIYQMVCDSMAAAIRTHAVDHGLDCRELKLLAFGGAGPVHACSVAELLEVRQVIFPPLASVLSAFGTIVSPIRLDLARAELQRLRVIDWDAVERIEQDLRRQGREALLDAGCAEADLRFSFSADMRYVGQQFEVRIDVPASIVTSRDGARLRELFEVAYERQYRVRLEEIDVEVVTWRASVYGPERQRQAVLAHGSQAREASGRRRVVFPGASVADVPVLSRALLRRQEAYEGPTLIEERETTIVIPPYWSFQLDEHGCVIATNQDRARQGAKDEVSELAGARS